MVALDEKGLSLVTCPCVIQEYINHNEIFYKVYVIDSEVMVFQRKSLPNLLPGFFSCETNTIMSDHGDSLLQMAQSRNARSLFFDSRYAYPTVEDFYNLGAAIEDNSFSSRGNGDSSTGVDPIVASTSTLHGLKEKGDMN